VKDPVAAKAGAAGGKDKLPDMDNYSDDDWNNDGDLGMIGGKKPAE